MDLKSLLLTIYESRWPLFFSDMIGRRSAAGVEEEEAETICITPQGLKTIIPLPPLCNQADLGPIWGRGVEEGGGLNLQRWQSHRALTKVNDADCRAAARWTLGDHGCCVWSPSVTSDYSHLRFYGNLSGDGDARERGDMSPSAARRR